MTDRDGYRGLELETIAFLDDDVVRASGCDTDTGYSGEDEE